MEPFATHEESCRAALDIYEVGACNPSGVALALHRVLAEVQRSGAPSRTAQEYAPARLILAQLSSLLSIELDGIGGLRAGPHTEERDLAWCRSVGPYTCVVFSDFYKGGLWCERTPAP